MASNLGIGHRSVRAQSCIRGSDGPQRLSGQRGHRNGGRVGDAEQEGDIEDPVVEPLSEVTGEGSVKAQLDLRVCASEPGDERLGDEVADALKKPHSHNALHRACVLADLCLCALKFCHDVPRRFREPGTGLCQQHPRPRAFEQLNTEFVLQRLDLAGDG
ncbi:hypothetical protein SUDANB23_06516 (plasmid) [Streptomyces sp. enrichment culture]